jgi:PPK2 family polyphosphate:nucleotide phosphotransferase
MGSNVTSASVLDGLVVHPGDDAALADRATDEVPGLDMKKGDAADAVAERVERIDVLQQRLFAESKQALLVVFQGMDTSGKDGAIKNVFRGITPAATQVVGFKVPSADELAHDFLWRIHAALPPRGRIGAFNRSHYEDVVATSVRNLVDSDEIDRRCRHINQFERALVDEGTTVVKVFLHLSKDEQRERLQARLDDPEKRWKFRIGDLDDRARWDAFQAAYERAITATSTDWAPWHVVPADRKWLRDVVVAELVARTLEAMDPQLPPDDPDLANVTVP